MTYTVCPFCSGASAFVEKISTSQLIDIYQKQLSIDIYHQFKDIKFIDFLQCEKCKLKFMVVIYKECYCNYIYPKLI